MKVTKAIERKKNSFTTKVKNFFAFGQKEEEEPQMAKEPMRLPGDQ